MGLEVQVKNGYFFVITAMIILTVVLIFIQWLLVVSHVTPEAIIKFVRIVTIMEPYFRYIFIS